MKTTVLLINMGGPESLEAVPDFLYQIFNDPDLIKIPIPGFLRPRFARWLAGKRAPESREIYTRLGGKTPLTEISTRQAQALQEKLGSDYEVRIAMRYWHPFIHDVWDEALKNGTERVIAVLMYPFYSRGSSGSIIHVLQKLQRTNPRVKLEIIDRFGQQPAFIEAMAGQLKDWLHRQVRGSAKAPDILFSAHSIPQREITKGDPYQSEIETCFSALKEKLDPKLRLHLSYQSKIGPVTWLGPATTDKIKELAAEGCEHLLMVPFGFVADNSETLYEMNMLYRQQAGQQGIKQFDCLPALNVLPPFIDLLAALVRGLDT